MQLRLVKHTSRLANKTGDSLERISFPRSFLLRRISFLPRAISLLGLRLASLDPHKLSASAPEISAVVDAFGGAELNCSERISVGSLITLYISNRPFALVSLLFAVLLSLSIGNELLA